MNWNLFNTNWHNPTYYKDREISKNKKCCFGGDINAFRDKHPGGDKLFECGGYLSNRLAKLQFLSYHLTKDFTKIAQIADKYGYTDVKDIKRTPFHIELDRIFTSTIKRAWIHGKIYEMYCIFITLLFLYLFFNHMFSATICIYNSIALAFVWCSYSFAVFHIRHHLGNTFIANKLLNKCLDIIDNIFCDVVQGWINRHQNNHHLFVNSHKDKDLLQLDPYFYVHKNHGFKYRFYHKYQTFYVPILLGLSQFDRVWAHFRPHEFGNKIYIFAYYVMWIVIPSVMKNDYCLYHHVLNYIGTTFLGGLITAYLFVISHNNELVPHLDSINVDDYDLWIKQQIEESITWSNNSSSFLDYMVTIAVGGINLQTEHHIAPGISPIYYLFAAKQIEDLCKKHDIIYNQTNNFGTAVYEFHKFLANAH